MKAEQKERVEREKNERAIRGGPRNVRGNTVTHRLRGAASGLPRAGSFQVRLHPFIVKLYNKRTPIPTQLAGCQNDNRQPRLAQVAVASLAEHLDQPEFGLTCIRNLCVMCAVRLFKNATATSSLRIRWPYVLAQAKDRRFQASSLELMETWL